MTCFQQINSHTFAPSNGDGDYQGQLFSSYHRRCEVAASFCSTTKDIKFYRRPKALDEEWKYIKSFSTTNVLQNIVGILSVEFLEAFAIVGSNKKESVLLIVDYLGALKANYHISDNSDICCVDFCHKTREFSFGFQNGVMICSYLNVQPNLEPQIVRRRYLSITLEEVQVPIQMAYFDLVGLILILTCSQNILCLDASTFDVVFTVPSHVFSLPPSRLWVDKFGTSFAVHCTSNDRNSEQLELWIPPRDYASCHVGSFDRAIVPLSSKLSNAMLETIGNRAQNCVLITSTEDYMVHLWSIQSDRHIRFENAVELNISPSISPNPMKDSGFPNLNNYSSVLTIIPSSLGIGGAYELLCSFGEISASLSVLLPSEADELVYQQLFSVANAKQVIHSNSQRYLKPNNSVDDAFGNAFGSKENKIEDEILYDDNVSVQELRVDVDRDRTNSLNTQFRIEEVCNYAVSPKTRLLTEHIMQERLNTPPPIQELSVVESIPPQPFLGIERVEIFQPIHDGWIHSDRSVRFIPSVILASTALTRPSTSKDIVPVPEVLGVQYFFLEKVSGNARLLHSNTSNQALCISPSWNLLWRGPRNLMQITQQKLLSVTAEELRTLQISDMIITHYSFASLANRIFIVTNMKDCLAYEVMEHGSKVNHLPLSVAHNTNINCLLAADVVVVGNLSSNKNAQQSTRQKGSTESFKNDSKQNQISNSISSVFDKFSLLAVGDSEGYIHFYITNNNGFAVYSDRYKAHNDAIQHLIVAGDASMAKWKMTFEVDYSFKNPQMRAIPTAGSALISISIKGEVKVWQPQALSSCQSSYPQRLFDNCRLQWRFAGIFSVDSGGAAGRQIVSATLSPECAGILLGMNSGLVEQWLLPGLIETNENAVASAQKPLVSFSCHSNLITSLRSYVLGPLSEAKEVSFSSEADRDALLPKLASYVRVPIRCNRTLGYSFQDMNIMKASSTLVSCSSDCSLILWSFEPLFFNYCSWVVPIAQRRFVFSFTPYQGLAFTKDHSLNYDKNAKAVWQVTVLLNGVKFDILEGIWSDLFKSSKNKIRDCRDLKKAQARNRSHIVRFEDDLKPSSPLEFAPNLMKRMVLPKDLLPPNPVVVEIEKASQLVACHKIYEEQVLHHIMTIDQNCLGKQLLEEWSKVVENPPKQVAFLDNTFSETSSNVHSDHLHLNLPDKPIPNPVLLLSEEAKPRVDRVQESHTSPTKRDLHLFGTADGIEDFGAESLPKDTVKFTAKGLFLEADPRLLDATKAIVEQPLAARYVLVKDRPSSPVVRPVSRHKLPSVNHSGGLQGFVSTSHTLKSTEFSFNVPPSEHEDRVMHERDISTPKGYLPQLEDYLSRPQSRESDDDTSVSSRTQISIGHVRFTKEDRVVTTILLEENAAQNNKSPCKVQPRYRVEKKADSKRVQSPLHSVVINNAADALPLAIEKSDLLEMKDSISASTSLSYSPKLALAAEVLATQEVISTSVHPSESANKTRRTTKSASIKYISKTATQQLSAKLNSKESIKAIPSTASISTNALSLVGAATMARLQSNPKINEDKDVQKATEEDLTMKNISDIKLPSQQLVTEGNLSDLSVNLKQGKEKSSRAVSFDIGQSLENCERSLSEERSLVDIIQLSTANTSDLVPLKTAQDNTFDIIAKPSIKSKSGQPQPLAPQPEDKTINLAGKIKLDDEDDSVPDGNAIDLTTKLAPPALKSTMGELKAPATVLSNKKVVVTKPKPSARQATAAQKNTKSMQALQLDLPDKRNEKRQKHALIVAKTLEEMGALEKLKDDARKTLGELESEESLITHYFDRNAKPIFVDRKGDKNTFVKQHSVGSMRSTKSSDIDNDSIASEEFRREYEAKTGKTISIPHSSHGRDDSLLLSILNELSEEERKQFEALDESTRERILHNLKHQQQMGGDLGDGSTFRALAEKAALEAKEQALLRMDIMLETMNVTDKSICVSFFSQVGGPVHIVLLDADQKYAENISPGIFQSLELIKSLPGLVEHKQLTVSPKAFVEVNFQNLRTFSEYVVVCAVDYLSQKMNTEALLQKKPWTMNVSTTPESLEIEWPRLSPTMKVVEIRAAIRCEYVQARAFLHFPPIRLPSDEELESEELVKFLSTGKESSSLSRLNTFLEWWIGSDFSRTAKIRRDFLHLECLHALQNKTVIGNFVKDGFAAAEEIQSLQQWAATNVEKVYNTLELNKAISIDILPYSIDEAERLFFCFRSWYKGGQVIQDFENAEKEKLANFIGEGLDQAFSDDMSSEVSLAEGKLEQRTVFLTQLIMGMDICIGEIKRLYDGYAYFHKVGLKESDLVMKRGNLSNTDITSIMCAKKLFHLMLDRRLIQAKDTDRLKEPASSSFQLTSVDMFKRYAKQKESDNKGAKTPVINCIAQHNLMVIMQRIADVDIFKAANIQSLKADDPPPVTMTPLPGTERRPLKSWQLLSSSDQALELALATSLLEVQELAVMDGIALPDPEDFLLDTIFTLKVKLCSDFRSWYAGGEELNLIPGMGVPTLARVLFAEIFEAQSVDHDPFLLQRMLEKKLPLPKRYKAEKSNDEEGANDAVMEVFESLLAAYQKAVNTTIGSTLRTELISRALSKIFASRRLNVLKFTWPPSMNRIGLQYLFPRMGLLFPLYSTPARRLKLFPSRKSDSYNADEILSWYHEAELDADDISMRKAEAQGQRMRAFHDWLAKEEERVEEARQLMILEDERSEEHRSYLKFLEAHFESNMKSLLDLDEELDANEARKYFRFQPSLPQEYWYIFEESLEYKYGSGIYNEDELEDIKFEQEALAIKAKEDALEFERYLIEEKKKRDNDEQLRLKREEQDRRLREGMTRRRQIREQLEELKRQKLHKQEEERLAKLAELEEERQQRLAWQEAEQERLLYEKIEADRQKELKTMEMEEVQTRDFKVASREIQLMQHEDIHSFLVEQLELKTALEKQAYIAELEELYTPYQPFQFKRSRVKLPALHSILKAEGEEESSQHDKFVMEELLDNMSAHDADIHSRLSSSILQEHETESVFRHHSNRYTQLFGNARNNDYSSLQKYQDSHSIHTAGSKSDVSHVRSVKSPPYNETIFVRPKDHMPTKKAIKSMVSKRLLPLNPHETQWELTARPQSPSLLSSVPFFVKQTSTNASPAKFSSTSSTRRPQVGQSEANLPSHMPSMETLDTAQLDQELREQLVERVLSENPTQAYHAEQLGIDVDDDLSSVFRSVVSSASRAPLSHSLKPNRARKKLQQLLSSSAAIVERLDQMAYLDYLKEQRRLAFASLSTLDHNAHQKKSLRVPLSSSAPLLAPHTNLKVEAQKQDEASSSYASLVKEAESMLDFKTRQLAHSASESVLKMQRDREALRQYISGQAIFEGDDYFAACEPGVKDLTSVESSPIARRFAEEIEKNIAEQGEEDGSARKLPKIPLPSQRSTPKAKKRKTAAGALVDAAADTINKPAVVAVFGSSLSAPSAKVAKAPVNKREVLQRLPSVKSMSTKSSSERRSVAEKNAKQVMSVDLFINTPRASLVEDDNLDIESTGGSSFN